MLSKTAFAAFVTGSLILLSSCNEVRSDGLNSDLFLDLSFNPEGSSIDGNYYNVSWDAKHYLDCDLTDRSQDYNCMAYQGQEYLNLKLLDDKRLQVRFYLEDTLARERIVEGNIVGNYYKTSYSNKTSDRGTSTLTFSDTEVGILKKDSVLTINKSDSHYGLALGFLPMGRVGEWYVRVKYKRYGN